MERTIQLEDFAALAPDALVLDVHRKAIYDASSERIAGASWTDPTQVEHWMAALSSEQNIIVCCVHGHEVSNGVLDHLYGAGFTKARLLAGGIEGLKAIGGEIVAK